MGWLMRKKKVNRNFLLNRKGTAVLRILCSFKHEVLLCFPVPSFGIWEQERRRQHSGLQTPAEGSWGGDINTCPGTTPQSSIFLFNNNKGIFSY